MNWKYVLNQTIAILFALTFVLLFYTSVLLIVIAWFYAGAIPFPSDAEFQSIDEIWKATQLLYTTIMMIFGFLFFLIFSLIICVAAAFFGSGAYTACRKSMEKPRGMLEAK